MTANWFEAKVKYMKVNEDGREKKVNEAYLLDAMSYTEAESRIMHEMESVISGDYYISSLKKSNITELVPSEDENDDRWYKAKVNIIDADEVSGKEKSTGQPRILTKLWRIWRKVWLLLWFLMRLPVSRILSLWMYFLIFPMKKNRFRKI